MNEDETEVILVSNEPRKRFRVRKSLLCERLPYFDLLFNSSFRDSRCDTFQIERLPCTTYPVEALLFESYMLQEPEHQKLEINDNVTLKEIVSLNRLAAYYGVSLQGTCESTVLLRWNKNPPKTSTSLEAFLKSVRALSSTSTDADAAGYSSLQTNIFRDLMRFGSKQLRLAHALSQVQHEKFWLELLEFITTSDLAGRVWQGIVIPYFRIVQSLPARYDQSSDVVWDLLASKLTRDHFMAMKAHRESNGHQHGDYALHPLNIISRLARVELFWCWYYWSDSENNRSMSSEDYSGLVHRLSASWVALVLNDKIDFVQNYEFLRTSSNRNIQEMLQDRPSLPTPAPTIAIQRNVEK